MSFTQEKLININPKQVQEYVSPGDRCDGCEVRCKLGYAYSVYGYRIFPTINEKIIDSYIDATGAMRLTGRLLNGYNRGTPYWAIRARGLAGKIAHLCDHYKTR